MASRNGRGYGRRQTFSATPWSTELAVVSNDDRSDVLVSGDGIPAVHLRRGGTQVDVEGYDVRCLRVQQSTWGWNAASIDLLIDSVPFRLRSGGLFRGTKLCGYRTYPRRPVVAYRDPGKILDGSALRMRKSAKVEETNVAPVEIVLAVAYGTAVGTRGPCLLRTVTHILMIPVVCTIVLAMLGLILAACVAAVVIAAAALWLLLPGIAENSRRGDFKDSIKWLFTINDDKSELEPSPAGRIRSKIRWIWHGQLPEPAYGRVTRVPIEGGSLLPREGIDAGPFGGVAVTQDSSQTVISGAAIPTVVGEGTLSARRLDLASEGYDLVVTKVKRGWLFRGLWISASINGVPVVVDSVKSCGVSGLRLTRYGVPCVTIRRGFRGRLKFAAPVGSPDLWYAQTQYGLAAIEVAVLLACGSIFGVRHPTLMSVVAAAVAFLFYPFFWIYRESREYQFAIRRSPWAYRDYSLRRLPALEVKTRYRSPTQQGMGTR